MLHFRSASVRIVNSERAISECFEIAFSDGVPQDCGVVIIYATLGHKLDRLAKAAQEMAPNAFIVGNSCAGTIGREGVGESMHGVAIMAICGPKDEFCVCGVEDIYGHNSYEKAKELAQSMKDKLNTIHTINLLTPGIDIAQDLVVKGFTEVFTEDVTLFGGSSSDNMKGIINYQYYNHQLHQHTAWAIGIADPTLIAVTKATHGFTAIGLPLVVTKSQHNKIIELNHKPAYPQYLKSLGLDPDATLGDSIPVGALAEKLSKELGDEYGNTHILRVVTKIDRDGTMHYAVAVKEGTELWLTQRDEELIFSEQTRTIEKMQALFGDKEPVAVFQTDCLARGRYMFQRIVKEELIGLIQHGLSSKDGTPPWLGMYGFGEYAKLGGLNTYHNYTTSLLALLRSDENIDK